MGNTADGAIASGSAIETGCVVVTSGRQIRGDERRAGPDVIYSEQSTHNAMQGRVRGADVRRRGATHGRHVH